MSDLKPLLQKITITIAIVFMVAFVIFAVNQFQTDLTAQEIVADNSRITQGFQATTHQLANELLAQNFYYDRALSDADKKKLLAVETVSQQSISAIKTTTIKTGINPPSIKNAELAQQKLENTLQQLQVIGSVAKAQICLNNEVNQILKQYQQINQLLEQFATSDTYADNSGVLLSMGQNYQNLLASLTKVVSCLDQPLHAESIYQGLESAIKKDRATIINYQQKYLQPLQELYKNEDYLAVPDFLDRNRDARDVKLIVVELFLPQIANNKSNYVAVGLRTILQGIMDDTASQT